MDEEGEVMDEEGEVSDEEGGGREVVIWGGGGEAFLESPLYALP